MNTIMTHSTEGKKSVGKRDATRHTRTASHMFNHTRIPMGNITVEYNGVLKHYNI